MSLLDQIEQTRQTVEAELPGITNAAKLEEFRLKHLVKKGTIQALTDSLRDVPKEEKPLVGKSLNSLKQLAQTEYDRLKNLYEEQAAASASIDVTLPGRIFSSVGSQNPVRKTIDEMISIFSKMGFSVAEGPEIEDDEHNFESLNFPADHPARDMQDTFFMKADRRSDVLLRTHTSPVQVRLMRSKQPPIRSIMPGRVYRNEAISARSLAEFHQVEGLYIDRNVSFAELKGTLVEFARQFYGNDVRYKFRPSFFPFTEPSAEMDITCFLCGGKGCRVCKHSGWLEILGCGMVHPNVLRAGGIDPEEYSGFAFGFGVERTAMLRTGIDDIRLLYENDIRIMRQFHTL